MIRVHPKGMRRVGFNIVIYYNNFFWMRVTLSLDSLMDMLLQLSKFNNHASKFHLGLLSNLLNLSGIILIPYVILRDSVLEPTYYI